MAEILGTVRLGKLKRIHQVLYFYRYPDKAPFRLDGEIEMKYISRGRGQYIPVRIKTDSWDLEKTFKLTFLEKIIEISAD